MQKKDLKAGDILLLLLYVDNFSSIKGRTRLQKMIFVFEKEIFRQYGFDKAFAQNASFDFESHNYGPFSKKIFQFIDLFENIGMVSIKYSDSMEEAFDNLNDEEIAIDDYISISDDYNSIADEENELPHGEPIYTITTLGKKYAKEKILNFINKSQLDALYKLKQSFNGTSLKKILKYVYELYPEMTSNSKIRERIAKEKWQF